MYESITIRFDGYLASDHKIAVSELGKSLVGLDRVINTGLIVLTNGRSPKRGERFDLVATAREPHPGSFEILTDLQNIPGVLPLVHEFLVASGTEVVFRFVSYILTNLGGRPNEAQIHIDALLKMNRDHLESRNRNDDQWRKTLLEVVEQLSPSARDSIVPVGKSASTLAITARKGKLQQVVDEPMADVIRSKENDEVGDMQEMRIKVDGIIYHSKQLKIEHPEIEGKYITAYVRDPLFEQFPNVYSEALSSLTEMKVMAKPIYRNGEMCKIYIMDANVDN